MKSKTAAIKIGFNALGFQSAWWLCVLGVIIGFPWIGPMAMTGYLMIHHRALWQGKAETVLILSAMIGGTLFDSIFAATGFLTYWGGYPGLNNVAPLWITAMWGGFAATLNHSLRWLQGRWLLAAVLGGVSGPLSYLAGLKFQAIQFNAGFGLTLTILAASWALAVPGLVWLQGNLNGRLK